MVVLAGLVLSTALCTVVQSGYHGYHVAYNGGGYGGVGTYKPDLSYNHQAFDNQNQEEGTKSYGYGVKRPQQKAQPFSRREPLSKSEVAAIWTDTGTVPNKLERVPGQLLRIKFGPIDVTPNMTIKMSQMQSRPIVEWDSDDPEALFLLLIEDLDILEVFGDVQFKHWIVTNIPGNLVSAGDETVEYLTSFAFATSEGGLDTEMTRTQRHQVLVYKQAGRLEEGEVLAEKGCQANWEPRFAQPRKDLVEKLGLEGPIAGNFYRVGYEEGWTEYYLCLAKRCTGRNLLQIPEPDNFRLKCLDEAK